MDLSKLLDKVVRLIEKKGRGKTAFMIFLSQDPEGSRYLSNAKDPKRLAELLRKCADDVEKQALLG